VSTASSSITRANANRSRASSPRATSSIETSAHSAPSRSPSSSAIPTSATVIVGRRKLNLTNLQKVLYPSGFTKGEVVDYYRRIAATILPHLKGRALTLKRYPNGSTDPFFFYEKRCPEHRPDWIKTAAVDSHGKHSKGPIDYCVVGDEPSLIWVAQLASLELHVPLARASNPNQPTHIAFDLDPGAPADLVDCCRLGLKLRDLLEHLGLQSFPKTSGSKGLHVYVPLNTKCTFDQTKAFANAIAVLFERSHPNEVVSAMRKDLRKGKILVDWSQNDRQKTTVCPYSLRARDNPTVSTPLAWREVEHVADGGEVSSLSFLAEDVLKRVAKKGALFEPVLTLKQKLPHV